MVGQRRQHLGLGVPFKPGWTVVGSSEGEHISLAGQHRSDCVGMVGCGFQENAVLAFNFLTHQLVFALKESFNYLCLKPTGCKWELLKG